MSEATGEGGERRLGVALAELGTRLIAKRLENHNRQTGFDSRSLRQIILKLLSSFPLFTNDPRISPLMHLQIAGRVDPDHRPLYIAAAD